jgi:hypothetical protein
MKISKILIGATAAAALLVASQAAFAVTRVVIHPKRLGPVPNPSGGVIGQAPNWWSGAKDWGPTGARLGPVPDPSGGVIGQPPNWWSGAKDWGPVGKRLNPVPDPSGGVIGQPPNWWSGAKDWGPAL